MSESLKDDLVAAKALIDTPEKWTKGIDHTRCRLCAMFAVYKAVPTGRRTSDCETALCRKVPSSYRQVRAHPVVAYNDAASTTHANVMALFGRAILAAGDGA